MDPTTRARELAAALATDLDHTARMGGVVDRRYLTKRLEETFASALTTDAELARLDLLATESSWSSEEEAELLNAVRPLIAALRTARADFARERDLAAAQERHAALVESVTLLLDHIDAHERDGEMVMLIGEHFFDLFREQCRAALAAHAERQ